ncbi:DUF3445 domain-containing protein [uncultured Roseibium sp.]|uniref:heme-dependent oxidative N-demethylase family protein n=1 Tax=uncultured Roseibium sp. TaxID=1936171 RepID=UPI00261A33AF|nr:DUF3445 domain-containing protein [uncultured Roseibium sp.]
MTEERSVHFQHRPYDGTSQPFTVGLKPVAEKEWLEPDTFLKPHLAEKARLLAERPDDVFRAEPDTEAAQAEVLGLVVEHLRQFHGSTHDVSSSSVSIPVAGRRIDRTVLPALKTASLMVQEDLVLMRPGQEGYRLVAASLCFPSSWSLGQKFGLSMADIHETVPDFNGARMGQMVARLFDNLKPGQILCRFNWSVYPDERLHHPGAHHIEVEATGQVLASLFLRVERQTLRRLSGSGDILFTIKIHHDPMAALEGQTDSSDVASGLSRQLLALSSEQLRYKGLHTSRDTLVAALHEVSERLRHSD